MKQSKQMIAALGLAALMAALAPAARAAEEAASTSSVDEQEEMRTMLGSLSSQLNDLKKAVDEAPKIGVNVDLRYDFQKFKYAGNPFGSDQAPVLNVQPAHANGGAGMYAKRVEVEIKGKTASWALWHLQFDFAGLKLEDLGVELTDLPMLMKGWTYNLKIGQFRQPFGIENQTGSSSTPFPERAMIDGGANPAGYAKLINERVMGLHLSHKMEFGDWLSYQAQFTLSNDTTDQVAGSSSLAGFPNQVTDQDPSEIGRFGISTGIIPATKVSVGASALHNSTNKVVFAYLPTQIAFEDAYGVDAAIETLGWMKFQAEWVAKNSFGSILAQHADSVLLSRAEGFYVESFLQILKPFIKDAMDLNLNLRYEGYAPDVNKTAVGVQSGPFAGSNVYPASENAITVGLKLYYVGKNYTSVNYTFYGMNNDFSSLPGTDLVVVQQQFNF